MAQKGQPTTASLRAGGGTDRGATGRAAAGGKSCTVDVGLLEMTFGFRAWQKFIRKAKTFLEMDQDRKKIVFARTLYRKRIGRNHLMSCLRISVETMGLVQVSHTGLFFT